MKVQELDGGRKQTGSQRREPRAARTCAIRMFTDDLERAEQAFAVLTSGGVDPQSVAVLARGPEVDRKLIFDPERNANQLADDGVPIRLSDLARKLSGEKKLLLDGCWACGPLFDRPPRHSGCGGETLVKALLRTGLPLKESTAIESALKNRGGVWLAANLDRHAASRIVEALQQVPGLEIEWLAAPSRPAVEAPG